MFETIIEKIREVNSAYPELRFQQIMSIAATKAGWGDTDLFYCPDNLIENGLDQMILGIRK